MPEPREFPFPNFAFRVKIGTEDEKAILAGFQEVSGLGAEVSGQVTEVAVADNQIVRAGDILFRIDPERFEIVDTAASVTTPAGSTATWGRRRAPR